MTKKLKKITGLLFSVIFFTVIAVNMPQVSKAATEVSIDETNFPDENFRNYVKGSFDIDNSGGLSEEEITWATDIQLNNKGIKNLKGVEYFTNLTSLNCSQNKITELDVSNNTNLCGLYCFLNQLTKLDVSQNTSLGELSCGQNKITELDLSYNTALIELNCFSDQLKKLKLHSQTYDKLPLYKRYLHGFNDNNLSDLQNITETETNNFDTVSLLKVIDIAKPATYKVDGKDFTIIYVDKEILPSAEPSAAPSTEPSAAPSTEPSATPSEAHIFSDYDYNNPIANDTSVIYGNGINKTIDGKKVNNKALTVYTDILASYKYTVNSKDIVKPSVGKVIVGVTKDNIKPTVNDKNKITSTLASKVAKAKIKNGQITVTAVGKEGGLVYLWVIDTGSKGVSACCPINVKLAPTKLEIQNISGSKIANNTKLENGKTLDVCVAGLVGSTKTEDGTYTATVDSKYQSYVTVTPVEGTNQFTINAKGLNNNKDTKVTITFKCDQNGKKTNLSLTITK